MSRLQSIAFPALLVLVATACSALGLWQLTRLAERRAANTASLAQREAPVVDLSAKDRPDVLVDRRIRAEGTFDAPRSFILRQRPLRGFPGVQVVTPLLLAGSDTAVLVNLGHVPAVDAVTINRSDLIIPSEASITGLAVAMARSEALAQPLARRGDTTWRHIVLGPVSALLPYPIHSFVVLRSAADSVASYPRPIPYPSLGDGPHLSYAIQWFSFATIALVGGGLWLRKRRINT
jgi:surfeit locus 1 family protein